MGTKAISIFILLFSLFSLSAQHTGNIFNFVAGETIGDKSFVFLDSLVYQADPTDADKMAIGWVLSGGSAGDTIQVFYDGIHQMNGGLTVGKRYYLTTGGAMTATKPTRQYQVVGVAMTDSLFLINISDIKRVEITESAALNFPSISSGRSSDLTVTVTGAALGDEVTVSGAAVSNMTFSGLVTATDTVTIRALNTDTGSQDIGSSLFTVTVRK